MVRDDVVRDLVVVLAGGESSTAVAAALREARTEVRPGMFAIYVRECWFEAGHDIIKIRLVGRNRRSADRVVVVNAIVARKQWRANQSMPLSIVIPGSPE